VFRLCERRTERNTYMSRGLGRIQRDIVANLENKTKEVDTFDLAAEIYGLEPDSENRIILNDAQLVSIRRALVNLAAAGKIFKVWRGHNKRAYWANERLGLWHTIRSMQQMSVHIGHTRPRAELQAHIDRMLPLIIRAGELSVDLGPRPQSTGPHEIEL
jgi:hypothetical protein